MNGVYTMIRYTSIRQQPPKPSTETAGPLEGTLAGDVYHMICRAAKAGRPCPTGREIGSAIDRTPPVVTDKIQLLEKLGLIKVERGTNFRIVEIVATGQRTARPVFVSRDMVPA